MAASQTTAATELGGPTGLLIYDGDCGFCTSSARWFADRAKRPRSVAPWQALDLDDYGLTEAEVSSAVYWADGGRLSRGADAIASALRVCPGPWRFVGTALSVPPLSWLGRALYPIVARNRFRLPGSTDACRLD